MKKIAFTVVCVLALAASAREAVSPTRIVWSKTVRMKLVRIGNGVAGRGARVRIRLGESVAEAMAELGEWMNGMPTYTLWWIRNLAEWYRYTGDLKYLQKHAAYLEATFDHVLTRMGAEGWLGEGAFENVKCRM